MILTLERHSTSAPALRRNANRLMIVVLSAGIAAACNDKKPEPIAAMPPPAPVAIVVPAPKQPPPSPPSEADIGPHQRVVNALALLSQGRDVDAHTQIVAALADHPQDALANDLLRQIETEPKVLLGERSYAYTIRRGETLSEIAGRLLGNRNRFWALARYNGIAVPETAEVGRTIQIPGFRPEAPAPRSALMQPKSVVAAPAPVSPPRNLIEASRLRSAGLSDMASGAIDQAVHLFQRALAFDPGNPTILGDLTRALRVQQTLRTH